MRLERSTPAEPGRQHHRSHHQIELRNAPARRLTYTAERRGGIRCRSASANEFRRSRPALRFLKRAELNAVDVRVSYRFLFVLVVKRGPGILDRVPDTSYRLLLDGKSY